MLPTFNAPNGGTLWKLCIDCKGSSCGGNIKRKKVHYNFIGSDYWECDNYKIDGHLVKEYGQTFLSVGKHSFSASCKCKTIGSICTNPFFGFPVISTTGTTTCSSYKRNQESCSIHNAKRVLEVK